MAGFFSARVVRRCVFCMVRGTGRLILKERAVELRMRKRYQEVNRSYKLYQNESRPERPNPKGGKLIREPEPFPATRILSWLLGAKKDIPRPHDESSARYNESGK
jgi:hypothetical protein